MKFSTTVILLALIASYTGFSQISGIETQSMQEWVNKTQNKIYIEKGLDKEIDFDEIAGSRFLDDDFKKGKIVFGADTLDGLWLRYDVFSEYMQVKANPKGETMIVSKRDVTVLMDGKEFGYYEYSDKGKVFGGYFQVILKPRKGTNEATLLLKNRKEIEYREAQNSSYFQNRESSVFNETTSYYLLLGSVAKKIGKEEEEFIALFPEEKQAQIKEYMDENRLKPRKEEDLIELVEYYNKSI